MLCLLWLPGLLPLHASESWPQFRGPDGRAVAASHDVPIHVGPQTNLLWRVPAHPGHSSLCIWGDRFFLTGHEGEFLIMWSGRLSDGKTLWEHRVRRQGDAVDYMHDAAQPAMPTPCTDGERVYFYFGEYGLVARDLEGRLVWEQPLPALKHMFGTGTSPLIVNDSILLVRDGAEDSAIHSFDTVTGKQRWKMPRFGYGLHYASPYLWKHAQREEVVIPGTKVLQSFDPSNGEMLWEVQNTTFFPCTTPTSDGDLLYYSAWTTANVQGEDLLQSFFDEPVALTPEEIADARVFVKRFDLNGDNRVSRDELPPGRMRDAFKFVDRNGDGEWTLEEYGPFHSKQSAPGRNIMVAVKPGGAGDVTASHVAWEQRRGLPYVASPLAHRGRVYLAKKGGFLTCLDAVSGEVLYAQERLGVGGEYYASPVGVGDHVLVAAERGTLFAVKAGDEFNVAARNEFGEHLFATPAVVNNRIYVRSAKTLWAFGK